MSGLVPNPRERNIITETTFIQGIDKGYEGEALVVAVPIKINPRDANEEINVAKRGHRLENETDRLFGS